MTNNKAITLVDNFISSLKRPVGVGLFNQWFQKDEINDCTDDAPKIRRRQLKYYLYERINKTKILLVGEAMGYQGGHFSGIAMTSERILLGRMLHKGIKPTDVFNSIAPERTSKKEIREAGFAEPTASIVWAHLLSLGIDSFSFAVWNALPFHPYSPQKGYLSNRTPTEAELKAGAEYLMAIINLLKPAIIAAVGEKASLALTRLNLSHTKVRHPANGGANLFRSQTRRLFLGSCSSLPLLQ